MTPRNTTHGASASARRTPALRAVRSAPSARTRPPRAATATAGAAAATALPAGRAPRSGKATAAASKRPSPKPATARKTPKPAKPAKRSTDPSVAWRWWLLPLVVLGVGAIFVFTYYPVAKVQYRETREKARLEAQLKGIQARNQRLQASVDKLKTPEGVEDYARSQLGMVKAGEHVVVVVDGSKPAASLPTTALPAITPAKLDSEEAVVPPDGPWTRFLDSIFGVQ